MPHKTQHSINVSSIKSKMPVVTDDERECYLSIIICCNDDSSTTHHLLAKEDITFHDLRRKIAKKEIHIPFSSYYFMHSDVITISPNQEKEQRIRSNGKGRGTLHNPYQVIIMERFYYFSIQIDSWDKDYVRSLVRAKKQDVTFHDIRRLIAEDEIPVPSRHEFLLGQETVQPEQEKSLIVRSTDIPRNGIGNWDDPYKVMISPSVLQPKH